MRMLIISHAMTIEAITMADTISKTGRIILTKKTGHMLQVPELFYFNENIQNDEQSIAGLSLPEIYPRFRRRKYSKMAERNRAKQKREGFHCEYSSAGVS